MFWETEGAVSISHEWVCYPCYIILQEKKQTQQTRKKNYWWSQLVPCHSNKTGAAPFSSHSPHTQSSSAVPLLQHPYGKHFSDTHRCYFQQDSSKSSIAAHCQCPLCPFYQVLLLLVQQPRRDDLKRLSWCMFSVNLSFVYTFVGSSVPGKILKTGFVRISLFLCKLCPHCFPFSSTLVYYVECSEYLSVLIQS